MTAREGVRWLITAAIIVAAVLLLDAWLGPGSPIQHG